MTVSQTEQPVFAIYPSLRGRTAFVSGGGARSASCQQRGQ
jgi:hypothetical protein